MARSAGLCDPSLEHDGCGVGFVAQLHNEKSRAIVDQGLEILRRLAHRAACGCDPETGDGAGIMLQIAHGFFEREARRLGFEIPGPRRYGVGQVFLPSAPAAREACERILEEAIEQEGQRVLGWRDVPVAEGSVGRIARSVLPAMRQVLIRMRRVPPSAHERKLYVIRKVAENAVRERGVDPEGRFHIASLSTERIVYKGLLLPAQLPRFYLDLQDSDLVSAIAVVHSRYSTNTFPTWDLAQPFHYIAHNGEINTLQGNRNWMLARRSQLQSAKFGGSLDRLFPIIVDGRSDSSQFDNMLELLHLGGRSLPHAMMMMIPEAWQRDAQMDARRVDFYRYCSSLIEPWDGPAAIVFCDGTVVGATLDRNGLRPARYLLTDDDRVILASEAGVLDVPPERVIAKGRLQPGRMLLVDVAEGLIIDDEEVKNDIAGRFAYGRWLEKNVLVSANLPPVDPPPPLCGEQLLRTQRAFGYTDEELRRVIAAMATTAYEPVSSMGTDAPLAVLSDRAPTLFHYFHQRFAQVTNPPIDPIREHAVMSLETTLGPEGNTFDETPEQCHHVALESPLLTNGALARLGALREGAFEAARLSLCFGLADERGLSAALARLCVEAVEAIDDGINVLILSDRGIDAEHGAIPALLAVSAVHQHLVREGIRMQAGIVVETAEAREVHDFALLISYGAAAVNPYLALDSIAALAAEAEPAQQDDGASDGQQRYLRAVEWGLLKVMSKMGISTIESYRGAQAFEAIGLGEELVAEHFTGTPSRIGGIGLAELEREVRLRHRRGFGDLYRSPALLDSGDDADGEQEPAHHLPLGGVYRWRRRGELHRWTPEAVAALQAATARDDEQRFAEFCRLVDAEGLTLRALLELDEDPAHAVPLDEVEPAERIFPRFFTGAMSFGSLSAEAHETIAVAMNRIGGRSNSGEGGEEPHRFAVRPDGDSSRSAIKQVASGRFGVTAHYLVNADELQIKMAQGAKPGEGGQLPGHKVDERIAKVRCSTPGVMLISPPPHHDIYSIEDLAHLVYDLQAINPTARISVKLVSQVGVGTVAAGVAKARAGCVVIAGFEGGTGAAPLSSIHHAGLPWELGLAETQQVLLRNRLRDRVRVQVDGGLRSARDVLIAALLGAEEFGFATAPLVTLGCCLLRNCHQNTCTAGIATQDPELRRRFAGRPERVVSYFALLAEQLRRAMARLGYRTIDEMVGRTERLRLRRDVTHWKARHVDLRRLLHVGEESSARHFAAAHPWPLDDHVDRALLDDGVAEAIATRKPIVRSATIRNHQRAAGALISGEIARQHGAGGLPRDTVHLRFSGAAGQSFGAFLAAGVTLELAGEANDYLGKGLSGGRIAVYPPRGSRFETAENVIAGNTVLYGATAGELFVSGIVGERFAVRNSGAKAVVEGVGAHGCEYMTGGVVVVLGETGRNFAAGMSGGVAYVFDRLDRFRSRCNLKQVELETLVNESEIWLVRELIDGHVRFTGSILGRRLLDNWDLVVSRFVKVMPLEYKRVLQAQRSGPPPVAPPEADLAVRGGLI